MNSSRYETAKEMYKAIGVDTELAIEKLKNIERNSKVDFVKNYGFEANWKNNLYLANGHCVK
mgnify:CR=1 FL=1